MIRGVGVYPPFDIPAYRPETDPLIKLMASPDYSEDPGEDFCCPICCDVLREPFLTECCGQHFCSDCIAKAKRKVNRCPYCQQEPLNGIIDKYFRRQLKDVTNDGE